MTRSLKYCFIIVMLVFGLALLCEAIFFFVGIPKGASRFAEKVVIESSLPLKKDFREFRIFTYGESTMHGAHYGDFSSPAIWLDEYLSKFLPIRPIHVVNFARVGCNSYFVLKTVRQTLAYKPDLMIFYIGHNGFIPQNTKREIEIEEATFSRRLEFWLQQSRFFSEIYRQFLRFTIKKRPPRSVKLEYGVETDPRTFPHQAVISRVDPEYFDNISYSKQNLVKIIQLAKKHQVPVIFLKPVCNLKDFAPSHSVHMKMLNQEELNQWNQLYRQGIKEEPKNNLDLAQKNYQTAYSIDSTYANLSFKLGRIYFQKKDYVTAKRFFEEARDNDAKINRATRDVLSIFESLAKEEDVIVIDTEEILKTEAEGGILGEPIVEDNVHFSIWGHHLLGKVLAQQIADHEWIAPKSEWNFDQEVTYEMLLQKLGIDNEKLIAAYFQKIQYFGTRFDNRIRVAAKILVLDPYNVRALRHLAWSYWLKGETDLALATYERLAQIDPQSLQTVFRLRPQIKRAFSRLRIPAPVGNF